MTTQWEVLDIVQEHFPNQEFVVDDIMKVLGIDANDVPRRNALCNKLNHLISFDFIDFVEARNSYRDRKNVYRMRNNERQI